MVYVRAPWRQKTKPLTQIIIIAAQLHLKSNLNIEFDLPHSRPEEQHIVGKINQCGDEIRTLAMTGGAAEPQTPSLRPFRILADSKQVGHLLKKHDLFSFKFHLEDQGVADDLVDTRHLTASFLFSVRILKAKTISHPCHYVAKIEIHHLLG